jgi:hypothetical protein
MLTALTACAQTYQFTADLSVGSTGSDVTALQTTLISAGYDIPSISAGAVNKGRFGSQTKTAVRLYQAAHGIPSTGFVGPLTRAALNGTSSLNASTVQSGSSSVSTMPASSGSSAGSAPSAADILVMSGIKTFGVQGLFSVTQGPISSSILYAGQSMAPLIDVRVQAQYSDLAVAGLIVDFGTSTDAYNYVFSKLYLVDAATGKVIVSMPLNNSTVVEASGEQLAYLAHFLYLVPKGSYKDLIVEADTYPTITNAYLNRPWIISIDPNSVGALDGEGNQLFAPITPFGQGLIVNQSQVIGASANVSLDSASPLNSSVGVTNTTQGTYLALPVMVFDVNAQGDNLHLHSATVGISSTNGSAITAAYLYQGSTPISSASISNGIATFLNITDGTAGASIPVNTTVPFTVKVDVSGLTGVSASTTITASTTSLTIYNSLDSNVSVSGSAKSNSIAVFGTGPVFSLASTPTIVKNNITPGGSSTTTFQYVATFNINAMSVGQNTIFGLPSGVPSFGTSTASAIVYANGVPNSSIPLVVSYSQPTNTTISTDGNYFSLGQNQNVTIPVTYSFTVSNPGANTYAVQLQGITTFGSSNNATTTTNFMTGQTQYRTTSI